MATNEAGLRLPSGSARAGGTAAARGGAPLLAYVLHRYDWSETSLIVELFTRTLGRVVVAAKGARRPTSQLRPVLLPFQPVYALLGKPPADEQGEVRTLRSAEWVGGRPLLGAPAMFAGFHVNELLLKLLARQDPHPALFDAYADTLLALAADADDASALRAFELVLLRELGWLPDLAAVTLTMQVLQPTRRYTLDPEGGLVERGDGLHGKDWVSLQAALDDGRMPAIRAACASMDRPLRPLLRQVLEYHLGSIPLRTRQVWQGVQRLARNTEIPTP